MLTIVFPRIQTIVEIMNKRPVRNERMNRTPFPKERIIRLKIVMKESLPIFGLMPMVQARQNTPTGLK